MENAIFEKYAELRRRKDEIDEEIKATEAIVLDELQRNELDKLQHGLGTFSRVTTTKWKYSETYDLANKVACESLAAAKKPLEEQIAKITGEVMGPVEEMRRLEQEGGIAQKAESVGLRFQAKK